MLSEFVTEIRRKLVESLRERLLAGGLRVEAPARLVGSSGAEYWAPLSAIGPDGKTIMVEIFVSHDLVDEEPVISAYAKILDTSPSQTFLLVMPKANRAANELAKSYGIKLIEGVSVDDLIMEFIIEFDRVFPIKTVHG